MDHSRLSRTRVLLLLLLAAAAGLGAAIWLGAGARRSAALEEQAAAPGAPALLEPGESIENAGCAVALPAGSRRESTRGSGANLVRSIRGRVLRGDGRPAAGIRVLAASVALRSVHPSDWAESADPPVAQCDEAGAFELRYQGPEELALAATSDGRFGLVRVFADGEQQAVLDWDDYRIEVSLAGERDPRDPGTLTCRGLPGGDGLWEPWRGTQRWSGDVARFEVEPERDYRVSWVSARRRAVVHDVHVRAEDVVTRLRLEVPPELELGSVSIRFEEGEVGWDAVNVSGYCLPSQELVCTELSPSTFQRDFVPGEYLFVMEARELLALDGTGRRQLGPLRQHVRVFPGQASELSLRFERAARLELTLLDAREREPAPVAWRDPASAQAGSTARKQRRPDRPWSVGLRAADGWVERPAWHLGLASPGDLAQSFFEDLRNLTPNGLYTAAQPLGSGSYEVWVRADGTTRLAGEIVLESGRTLRASFALP